MLELKLHTLLVVAHLIGLALGAGGALVTDMFVARYAILGRIEARTPDVVEFLGNIVAAGLVILWLTGLALMAEAMILKPLFYTNQKFWAKFAIVILLTINGINIHNRIMPILRAQAGRKLFDGLPGRTKITLCATGAISAVSWMFPILLGSAKELSYVASFVELMALYFVALLAVTALAAGFATKLSPLLETWQFGEASLQSAGMPSPTVPRSSRATLGRLPPWQRTDTNTDDTSAFLADTLREVRTLAGASSMQPVAYIPRRQARIQGGPKVGAQPARRQTTSRLATA